MAAFTTTQAGNWSSASTWGGIGPPGSGDTATVNHAVVVDVNTVVGVNGSTSLTVNADLKVANGVSFTVKGDVVQANAYFHLGDTSGADLVFDCTAGDVKWLQGDVNSFSQYANCYFQANGTSGRHATVSKTGSHYCWFDSHDEGAGSGDDKTGWDCAYCDFSNIGKSDGSFMNRLDSFGNKHYRFAYCTFTGCGTLNREDPGFGWGGGANKDYYVRDCVFASSTGTHSLRVVADGSSGSGAHDITGNDFDKPVDFNAKLDLQYNLFRHSANVAGGPLLSNRYNLFCVGNGEVEVQVNSDVDHLYWLSNLDHPGNPHCLNSAPASATIDSCLFEYCVASNVDSGECVYTSNGGLTVKNCLAIPSETDGYALGNICHHGTIATGSGWNVLHNTCVGANNPFIAYTEATSDPGSPLYADVLSNLAVCPSGTNGGVVWDTFVSGHSWGDIVPGANAHHNGVRGLVSFTDTNNGHVYNGYRAHFSADPGANDVSADPLFFDSARNFSKYAVYKGVATGGDSQATKHAAGKDYIGAAPRTRIPEVIAWIYAGFAPTNAAFQAAHDNVSPSNGWIGAVEGAAAWTISPSSIPNNHGGNITLTLVGTGTSWVNGTTVFTPSGVSGVVKVSQHVTDSTHATVVVTTSSGTGTLTVTESVTGAGSATTAVGVPAISASPNTGSTGGSVTVNFTGTNTVWTQDSPVFSLSGGTGASIGATTVVDDTHAHAVVTYGSSAGVLTVTDSSTSKTCSITVVLVDRQVVFEGGSYTAAQGASTPFGTYLSSWLGTRWSLSNVSAAGDRLDQMESQRSAQVDAAWDLTKAFRALSVEGGSNDLAQGAAAATVYGRLQTYVNNELASAHPPDLIIVWTVPDRQDAGLPGGFQAERATYNDLVRSGFRNFGPKVVVFDVAADTRFSDATNTSWYQSDKINVLDAGQQAFGGGLGSLLLLYADGGPAPFGGSVFLRRGGLSCRL